MKTSIFFLFAFWLLASSSCRSTRSASKTDPNGFSYLALGDSYTIGESVGEQERYPDQLAAALTADGILTAAPQIVARTGWTTADLQQGIAAASLERKTYDVVTLLIGVNNEFQHRSIEEYAAEFAALLEEAILFADGKKDRVFVLSIPDYGYTPYGKERQAAISARIDRFNDVNKRIAVEKQVHYVDITPVSRNGFSDPGLVADDGLHPSGKQYGLWTAALKKEVAAALKKK